MVGVTRDRPRRQCAGSASGDAGGDPAAVTVVAVTKEQPAGSHRRRRSRPGSLSSARTAPTHSRERARPRPPHARWHYLGQIQRNKVAAVAPHVAMWQSVDRAEAGAAIAKHAPDAEVLVQVNLTDDPNRGGATFDDVPALVSRSHRRRAARARSHGGRSPGRTRGGAPGFTARRAHRRRSSVCRCDPSACPMTSKLRLRVARRWCVSASTLFGARPQSTRRRAT